MKLRFTALIGVLSLAGLGLVGAGAHAVFTQNTQSNQTVTAGTLNVTVSATCSSTPPSGIAGSQAGGTACGTYSNNDQTVTLPDVSPVGSSFVSPESDVTVTNNSDITAYEMGYQVTDTSTNTAWTAGAGNGDVLASDLYVCLTSDGTVMYNGPLQGANSAEAGDPTDRITPGVTNLIANPLAPNGAGTDMYGVVLYAGTEVTGCGIASGWAHWSTTPPEYSYTNYATPSVAPSLGNNAEGGSDTVSVTFTFSG
jgi:predicted ribosomally synthesized peptide with SipW-like signal peptide